MLNINISFDHEIYFGENFYSENEILFEPSYRLMEVLVDNNVSATYFTDVCSVFKYRSEGLNDYPEKMEDQLKVLIANSQDVQLHIHSHWYKSSFKNGKWNFDEESYKIHSFGFKETNPDVLNANKIIKDGKDYLETLLKSENEDYKCIAFRAGGFCLQPERDLIEALVDNGIMIDSSIVKHLNSDIKYHDFSFKELPKDVNWWINPQNGIKINADANPNLNIFEVPIGSTIKKPLKWFLSRKNVPLKLDPAKGTFIPVIRKEHDFLHKKINRLKNIWNSPIILSLDYYRSDVLLGIIKEYLNYYDCVNNNIYVSVIGHPKLMGKEHIQNMDSFIKKAKKLSTDIKFCNMQDIYKEITNKL